MLNINNGFHCGIVGFCMKQSWLNVMARRAGRAHCRMRIFLPLSSLWALSCTTGGSHGLLKRCSHDISKPPWRCWERDEEGRVKAVSVFLKTAVGRLECWDSNQRGGGWKQGGLFVALHHTRELHSLVLQTRAWAKWPVWTNRRVVSVCESLIRSLQIMLLYLGVRVECFVIVCGLNMNKSLDDTWISWKTRLVVLGNKM